jgi:hypothetical protein
VALETTRDVKRDVRLPKCTKESVLAHLDSLSGMPMFAPHRKTSVISSKFDTPPAEVYGMLLYLEGERLVTPIRKGLDSNTYWCPRIEGLG